MKKKGKLYLIPTFLAETEFVDVMPNKIKIVIENTSIFFVEDLKSARRYIKKVVPSKIIDETTFFQIGKHDDLSKVKDLLNKCIDGFDIGIISEAGVPAVADPGSEIVYLAHKMDIDVVPLVGPSSILMAVMASGLGGQNFAFNGYLPIDKNDRKKKLKDLELRAIKENQSQIFIETPYRNMALFDDMLNALSDKTEICIACEITSENEFIKTKNIAQWRKSKLPELNKKPTVFIIK